MEPLDPDAPRWTHVTVAVRDLDRSVAFYTAACGLRVVRDRRAERGTTVWLGRPPAEGVPAFVLVLELDTKTPELATGYGHLGFQLPSREAVDRVAREAAERGAIVKPPTDSGGSVGYWVMVRDPDGYVVEFTHGQPLAGL